MAEEKMTNICKIVTSGLLVLVLHLIRSEALQCLKCDHVSQARDCTKLATCGPHEICYVQRLIGSNLKQYYKLGCTDTNVCLQEQASMFVGKRDVTDISHDVNDVTRDVVKRKSRNIGQRVSRETNDDMVLCLQCCSDADGCNDALCGSAPTNNRRCLFCNDVMEPKDCEHVEECTRDQYCYVHKGENPHVAGHQVRHDMGCMGLRQCDALKQAYPTKCFECCNHTDLCNYVACDNWQPNTPAPTTSVPRTSTLPVTQSPKVIINGPDKGKYLNQTQLTCVTVPPAQTYYWKFNGSATLPQNVRTQQQAVPPGSPVGTDILTISSLSESTFGTYTCVAITSGQLIEQVHFIDIIPVAPSVTIVKPPVLDNFVIQCKTTGYPVPHIEWDFLPKGLGSHGIPPGVQFKDEGHLSTLFVNDYKSTDHDGVWYCKAKNSMGSAIGDVHIP